MQSDNLYLEDMITYFHDKTLEQHEDKLLEAVKDVEDYEKNTIYNLKIFSAHIQTIKHVKYLDDITSSVARCVEYGLKLELQHLLLNLELLLSLATHHDGITTIDKRLLLRKCDLPCYLIAKELGFVDIELEKRISSIQSLCRNPQSIFLEKDNIITYEGPRPEEFFTKENGIIDYSASPRYWGYRHTMYFLKWNRKDRYMILKLIKNQWWGDCRYQAYVDYLEPDSEDNLRK